VRNIFGCDRLAFFGLIHRPHSTGPEGVEQL
jgi:hypothetical protein